MVRRTALSLIPALALIACAPLATIAGQSTDTVKGMRPTYGPSALSSMPNAHAIAGRIWAPDLDLGFDPQGITVAADQLLVSGYRSLSRKEHSGPCWLVRVSARTGQISGRLEIPAPCRHAGGVTLAPDGTIYVSDTNSLFAIDADSAFTDAPIIKRIPLTGFNGAFTAAGAGFLWIGTYDEKAPGKIYAFDPDMVRALPNGEALAPAAAKRMLPIARNAQGAAIDRDGKRLWIARSGITSGALDEIDLATGQQIRSHDAAAAIEGITFDGEGTLWAVSEAGVRHYYDSLLLQMALPFHPILFRLRPGDLE